jgi:HlyD family secretion protein
MRPTVAIAAVCAFMVGLTLTSAPQSPNPAYITAPVERGKIETLVKASGAVEAVLSVDVSSQLSGRVAEVFVGYNDHVSAGQPLAQIDQEIFSARVNEAAATLRVASATAEQQRATLERAKLAVTNAQTAKRQAEDQSASVKVRQEELERDLKRKIDLAHSGSGTEHDLSAARASRDAGAADLRASLDQVQMKVEATAIAQAEQHMAEAGLLNAQAVVEQRRAALDQAKLDLEHTVLRAPIDGIVIKRDVNPGQTVAVSLEAKTLFKIANDLGEMEVHGKIDEADIGQLRLGQRSHFTVDAYPDRTFSGQVVQIRKAPEVVQNVVTYTAIMSAPNPDLLLLPGMTAQLRIIVSDTGRVLKVPTQALRFKPRETHPAPGGQSEAAVSQAPTIWVLGDDGQARPLPVRLGASDGNSSEVVEGELMEGQKVILGIANAQTHSGYFGLRLGF